MGRIRYCILYGSYEKTESGSGIPYEAFNSETGSVYGNKIKRKKLLTNAIN